MKIAVLDDYQRVAATLADWASLGADVVFFDRHFDTAAALVAALADAEVVVAMRERTAFSATVLEQLGALRLLVSLGGARNPAIDLAAAARCGITVCHTGYTSGPTIEHTWALILAAARNLPAEFAGMSAGGWQRGLGRELRGRVLGLAGLGRIGGEVARIGAAFGMELLAWSQHLTHQRATECGATRVSRSELFERADVLSIHLLLSDRTRGLVGAADLARMKPDSLLVNTSRGPIVDEAALIQALRAGQPAMAALDVFDTEPLPVDHPLRTLGNVVLTPHLGYVSKEMYRVFYGDAVQDIAAFAAGAPIRVMTG